MRFIKFVVTAVILIGLLIGFNYYIKNYVFPFKHKDAIMENSNKYNLDPYFVLAVIKAESKFKAEARSNKNAIGLMQITEETGSWIADQMKLNDYTPDKLCIEEYNIKMGCFYLSDLQTEFNDKNSVIAAYNAGRGRVNEWLSNSNYSKDGKTLYYIPYQETKNYVDKVNMYYKIYKFLYE